MATSRIYISSLGVSDWRGSLADPDTHWKRGRSAWELAVCWEAAKTRESGLPGEVEDAFASHPVFAGSQLLIGVPEHPVELDVANSPSMNDLWAFFCLQNGYASVTVEAKAGEPFGDTVAKWLEDDKLGTKHRRLAYLARQLAVPSVPNDTRYQLIHRTVSAHLEAVRWKAQHALMLVQSFADSQSSWKDYCSFCSWLGVTPKRGGVSEARVTGDISLYLSWVDCVPANDSKAAAALGG